LAGNNPTSIALGPDGNLYVGFLKNGNVVRITNPTVLPFNDPLKTQVVQSVGTAPNGRPVRSLTFVGANLYLGTPDGLSVIKNATASTCLGGCNGVPVVDGFTGMDHVGLTTVYTLSIGRGGNGTVTGTPNGEFGTLINCGSSCSAKLQQGSTVTLTATPAAGLNFTGWSRSCAGTNPTCSITISSDTKVQANFK
jgi:hypothetical protein